VTAGTLVEVSVQAAGHGGGGGGATGESPAIDGAVAAATGGAGPIFGDTGAGLVAAVDGWVDRIGSDGPDAPDAGDGRTAADATVVIDGPAEPGVGVGTPGPATGVAQPASTAVRVRPAASARVRHRVDRPLVGLMVTSTVADRLLPQRRADGWVITPVDGTAAGLVAPVGPPPGHGAGPGGNELRWGDERAPATADSRPRPISRPPAGDVDRRHR